MDNAHSAEFDDALPEDKKAVVYMPEISQTQMGGTMRLGARATIIKKTLSPTDSSSSGGGQATLAAVAYGLMSDTRTSPENGDAPATPHGGDSGGGSEGDSEGDSEEGGETAGTGKAGLISAELQPSFDRHSSVMERHRHRYGP